MRKLKIFIITAIFLFSGLTFGDFAEAKSQIVNPNQTYTYNEMVRDIKLLQRKYPDLIHVKVIGKSEFGRDIYAFSVGKGTSTVFINGSHHAREWLTTNLNMYMADQYAYAYTHKQKINGYDAYKILNSTTIWFVPMVNPDGVTLQQSGLKAFPKKYHKAIIKMNDGSKNFKRWKANGKGVDLNRQYDANWKYIKGPSSPYYKNYKGKAPESAAETKALLKFVETINPEMAVSYHSTGEILYWKFKQAGERYKRDHAFAKKIGSMTGYSLMYPSNKPGTGGGGFTDWFVDAKKRPAFTPEISRYYTETNPPISEFPKAWRENKAIGLYVAQESTKLFDKRYQKSVDRLVGQYKTLENETKKLKTYYYTNVKSTNDLKIEQKFTDIYNKVKKESAKLEASAKKLPSKYKSKYTKYQSNIKNYLMYSGYYTTSIKAGDQLATLNQSFTEALSQAESIQPSTAQAFDQLIAAKTSSEKAIAKMYGKMARTYATTKYIEPAQATINSIQNEMDRYNLLSEIEKQINEKNADGARENLAKVILLEEASAKVYPKIHQALVDRRVAVEGQLKVLENSLNGQVVAN
ncbi:M14 family zinc carboxypeptidase [Bacillus massilinigeriensis]|uniref:M14 family zinc carboxypeptidase n=1 Tax=Bacillus massilionigeriensis TaxID=1805475 RepID=UPI00096B66AF|nr:M14 family zinc carboxypeptidase [Bacillus massilionigeriensis]